MNPILTAALFLLTLIACSKENSNPITSTKYNYFHKEALTSFTNFRLFTKNGEVNDAALVQQYQDEFSNYFFTPSSSFNDIEFTRFAMVQEDSFMNVGITPVAELKRASVDVYDKFISRNYQIENDTNNLILHISKYKMYEARTTSLGDTYFAVESPAYIFKKLNDHLNFPMVRFIIVSRGNSFSFGSGGFNNVFSAAGLNKLGNNDTLLLQSFDLVMKKVNE